MNHDAEERCWGCQEMADFKTLVYIGFFDQCICQNCIISLSYDIEEAKETAGLR